MTDTKCRYDRETGEYLTDDGETCDTPRREHCQARRTCSVHLGWGELTCARCVGRVRLDVRNIVELITLMLPEAMARGSVECEAASLAGPAGDPVVTSWRRVNAAKAADSTVTDGIEELTDPTDVLGSWQFALSEDYRDELPDRVTLATASAYLDRNLNKIAQDENQDFGRLRYEVRKCRQHLEAVLRDSQAPQRGAPCPTCKERGQVVRLQREFPHWCDDKDCTQQFHFTTDEADVWVCPANREHWWTAGGYAEYLEERMGA